MKEFVYFICDKKLPRDGFSLTGDYLDYKANPACDSCTNEYRYDPKAIRPFLNWVQDKLERKKK